MFEKPPQGSLQEKEEPQQKSFDERWFSRFSEAGNLQAYEYFEGDKASREEEKKAFLAGEKENPHLDYPKLDAEAISLREQKLLTLKEEILAEEKNGVIKQVYRWRINEKVAELRMMKAAAEGDMRRFGRYSRFVYGEPTMEFFQHTLAEADETIKEGLSSEDESIQKIARFLQDSIRTEKSKKISSSYEADQVVKIQESTQREFGNIIDIPEKAKGEKWKGEEIREIFEESLKKIAAEGWVAVIAKGARTGINTSQEKQAIEVPESREVTTKKLKALLVHELGTHVKRRVNGERMQLRLLSLGLDRYEKGEEGVTTLREGVVMGKQNEYGGFDSHFPIGLALGMDGGEKRDFRRVFGILKNYALLKSLLKGVPYGEAEEKAETTAWNRCVRIFRGTDCSTPGVAFTKDIVYREGHIGVWDTVTKNIPGTTRLEMMRWSIGKYDPSNERHIWVLSELGITDEDLEALEK